MVDYTYEDFITGEKFESLADFSYLPGSSIPEKNCIIFCKTDYLNQCIPLIEQSNYKFILISHNSDGGIVANNARPFDYHFTYFPKNVIKWFAQNVDIYHKDLVAIPIGHENEQWFPETQKKKWILEFIQMENKPQRDKLLYINHNINTNKEKRLFPYEFFKNKDWCTIEYGQNGYNFLHYRDQLMTHKFVLAPDGCGIDSHRIYESLSLGCIPIVNSHECFNQFHFLSGMDIINIDYQSITKERLETEYMYRTLKCSILENNLEQLKFSYWKGLIEHYSIGLR